MRCSFGTDFSPKKGAVKSCVAKWTKRRTSVSVCAVCAQNLWHNGYRSTNGNNLFQQDFTGLSTLSPCSVSCPNVSAQQVWKGAAAAVKNIENCGNPYPLQGWDAAGCHTIVSVLNELSEGCVSNGSIICTLFKLLQPFLLAVVSFYVV